MEEIETIYDLDLNSPTCKDSDKALAKWWQYDFLGYVIGPSTWSGTGTFDNRKYRIPTEKVWIDDLGETRVAVTITSEAFARVIYKNNRDRWIAIFKYKAQHGERPRSPIARSLLMAPTIQSTRRSKPSGPTVMVDRAVDGM